MSAEKFALSNVLANITQVNSANSRSKQPDNNPNTEKQADIFSRHLDSNLTKVAAPDNATLQKSDLIAQTDRAASIAKENLEKDQLNQSRAEKNIEKKLTEKQQRDETRIEEQRQKDEQAKEARSKDDKDQSSKSDDTGNTTDTTEQTVLAATSQPITNETAITQPDSENQVALTELTGATDQAALEAAPAEQQENSDLTAEQRAALAALGDAEQTADPALAGAQDTAAEAAAPAELTDENTSAIAAAQAQNQTDPASQNKDAAGNKSAASDTLAKSGNAVESTLGQQDPSENGSNGKNNGQNSDTPKPLISDAAKKDVSLGAGQQGQNATAQPQQGANPHANAANNALFANNLLGENSLKAGGLTSGTAEITQASSNDTNNQINTQNSTNTDLKPSTPAQFLRAAGYTSPTQSVAVQIAAKAQNGAQQFEIRLNPPELGRVDVRLEFTKDGQVNTHLIVERPETLELLSKDARQLEQALQQAGVNIENDGLTFSLKDQGDNNQDQANNFDQQENGQNLDLKAEELQIDTNAIYRQLSSNSAIDISV